jgi:hypothetical protein
LPNSQIVYVNVTLGLSVSKNVYVNLHWLPNAQNLNVNVTLGWSIFQNVYVNVTLIAKFSKC